MRALARLFDLDWHLTIAGGAPDPVRLGAIAVTLLAGALTRNMIAAITAGGLTFYLAPQILSGL